METWPEQCAEEHKTLLTVRFWQVCVLKLAESALWACGSRPLLHIMNQKANWQQSSLDPYNALITRSVLLGCTSFLQQRGVSQIWFVAINMIIFYQKVYISSHLLFPVHSQHNKQRDRQSNNSTKSTCTDSTSKKRERERERCWEENSLFRLPTKWTHFL